MEGATAVEVAEVKKPQRDRGSGRLWQIGNRWWFQYYDSSGRQIRESSKSEKKIVAEKLLMRRLGEKEAGLLSSPKKARVTVDELYQDELEFLAKSRKDIGWVQSCWELRLKEFFGVKQRERSLLGCDVCRGKI